MKTKGKIALYLLGLIFIVQLTIPLLTIAENERVQSKGRKWKMLAEPVDPSDPFRGAYVRLRFRHDRIAVNDAWIPASREEVWITLAEDSSGWAMPVQYSSEKQRDDDSEIQVSVNYVTEDFVYFDYPFERFYLEESRAAAAEEAYRKAANDSLVTAWAEISIYKGMSGLYDVKMNGISLREINEE